jgi:hypothetical protein
LILCLEIVAVATPDYHKLYVCRPNGYIDINWSSEPLLWWLREGYGTNTKLAFVKGVETLYRE